MEEPRPPIGNKASKKFLAHRRAISRARVGRERRSQRTSSLPLGLAGDPPLQPASKAAASQARRLLHKLREADTPTTKHAKGKDRTRTPQIQLNLLMRQAVRKSMPAENRSVLQSIRAFSELYDRFRAADRAMRFRLIAHWWTIVNQEPPESPGPVANPPGPSPKPRQKQKRIR